MTYNDFMLYTLHFQSVIKNDMIYDTEYRICTRYTTIK